MSSSRQFLACTDKIDIPVDVSRKIPFLDPVDCGLESVSRDITGLNAVFEGLHDLAKRCIDHIPPKALAFRCQVKLAIGFDDFRSMKMPEIAVDDSLDFCHQAVGRWKLSSRAFPGPPLDFGGEVPRCRREEIARDEIEQQVRIGISVRRSLDEGCIGPYC